jgi:hypothetical protein
MEKGGMGCLPKSKKVRSEMRQRGVFAHPVTHGDVR